MSTIHNDFVSEINYMREKCISLQQGDRSLPASSSHHIAAHHSQCSTIVQWETEGETSFTHIYICSFHLGHFLCAYSVDINHCQRQISFLVATILPLGKVSSVIEKIFSHDALEFLECPSGLTFSPVFSFYLTIRQHLGRKELFFPLVQSLYIQIFPLFPLFLPPINYTTFIQLLMFLFSCLFFASFISGQSVSSVPQLCPTLCDPMDRSTPGLPVHHQLLEFTQTHVHHIGDAIQPSHPLLSPSPPTFNLSQHQGLFQ